MGHIRRLIFASLAACFTLAATALSVTAEMISFVFRDAPVWLDAKTSLALDRITAVVAILPPMRSRFVAFVERALAHDHYVSGHFDPGRSAA